MKVCYFCGEETEKYAMVGIAEDIKTVIKVPCCPKCGSDISANLSPEDFITDNVKS